MVEFIISFEWIVIGITLITALLVAPRIVMNLHQSTSKSQRKLQQLDNEYIEELESQVRKYKNKASNMERGPTVEGDISELDSILPELMSSFESYAPKWLKPFLGNKDTQKWLIDYAQKNPEKVQGMIAKVMKKKAGAAGNEQQTETLSV